MEEGFGEEVDQTVYGVLFGEDGEYVFFAKLELGIVFIVGDFDGDDLCDLVVGTVRMSTSGKSGGTSGVVLVYKGSKEMGIILWLVRIYGAINFDNFGTYFGRRLVVADFDNDGLDDLVVG